MKQQTGRSQHVGSVFKNYMLAVGTLISFFSFSQAYACPGASVSCGGYTTDCPGCPNAPNPCKTATATCPSNVSSPVAATCGCS